MVAYLGMTEGGRGTRIGKYWYRIGTYWYGLAIQCAVFPKINNSCFFFLSLVPQVPTYLLFLKVKLNANLALVNCELKLQLHPTIIGASFAAQRLMQLCWDIPDIVVDVQYLEVGICDNVKLSAPNVRNMPVVSPAWKYRVLPV